MTKPPCKKIQYQASSDDQCQWAEVKPINHPELVFIRPAGDEYYPSGKQGMNDEVNGRESDVGGGMPALAFFVMGLEQWYGIFNDPQKHHAFYKKTRSFEGSFFKIAEIGDQRIHIKSFND